MATDHDSEPMVCDSASTGEAAGPNKLKELHMYNVGRRHPIKALDRLGKRVQNVEKTKMCHVVGLDAAFMVRPYSNIIVECSHAFHFSHEWYFNDFPLFFTS